MTLQRVGNGSQSREPEVEGSLKFERQAFETGTWTSNVFAHSTQQQPEPEARRRRDQIEPAHGSCRAV